MHMSDNLYNVEKPLSHPEINEVYVILHDVEKPLSYWEIKSTLFYTKSLNCCTILQIKWYRKLFFCFNITGL